MKFKALSQRLEEGDTVNNAADSLIKYNPNYFMTYKILGDYYGKMDPAEKAADYYRMALTKEPPSEAERKYIEKQLH